MERRARSAPEVRREIELTTLLESMPEGVLIVDVNGCILDVNSAAQRFTQRSREELKGTAIGKLTKLVSIQEEESASVEFPGYAAMRALRGERIRNERRTFRLTADNGATIEALVSANPIRDGQGEIIGALVMISDITELTQLQRRVADTERHHAVGQMAAGLAHDFSNVLDTIAKAITVMELRGNVPPEKRQQYLNVVSNAVRSGAEIIARVRQYLRDGSAELTPIDVRQMLDETVEMTRPLWEAQSVRVSRDLKPVRAISGNVADLRRVFTNLIINGIEAMPHGGELSVACHEDAGTVRIDISDTGQGIPPDQQKKIFYPYFTTKASGTGLGLSGAQRTVLSMGGNIHFHTAPGRGTRFTIELPTIESTQQNDDDGNGNDVRHAA
jgi:PAS domain S-box-containing protein